MLVLGRRPGEKIRIGDQIEIEIVSIDGQQAHVGISAPRELSISRPDPNGSAGSNSVAPMESHEVGP
jgi:carbon storage regulator CsrA